MNGTRRPNSNDDRKPERQTDEDHGSVKSRQQRNAERSDTARGSETETRAAASRRG